MTIGPPGRPPKSARGPLNSFPRTAAVAGCVMAIGCLAFAPGCKRSEGMPTFEPPSTPVAVVAAERRDEPVYVEQNGKCVGRPHVTVYHNGIKIHDKFTLPQDAHKGHFHFQDHNNPVRFRNIWVLPVGRK